MSIIVIFCRCKRIWKATKKTGCHLLINSFELGPHFCVILVCMLDTMHQIDLGGIMAFLKAILRKYHECIETQLNICGKAAWKLTACLQMMFKKYNTTQHTLSGKHACLLPLTYGTAMVFMQLLSKHKTSRHYRATDNRHPLLVLRFILDNLFCGEVDQFNRSRQGQPRVIDPSAELVAVANTFLAWYKFFRSITPPKTASDVTTLQLLSHQ